MRNGTGIIAGTALCSVEADYLQNADRTFLKWCIVQRRNVQDAGYAVMIEMIVRC